MKLCEAIAILKGTKARCYAQLTENDKLAQKPDLFAGLVKRYEPFDEEDPDRIDVEKKHWQQNADALLRHSLAHAAQAWDATAAQEYGNAIAKADVVVDGETLIESAPVPLLLYLEKQLNDIHTLAKRLPELPAGHQWSFDPALGAYAAEPVTSLRTKKTNRVVMTTTKRTTAPDGSVTEEQTGEITREDLPVGRWVTTHYSTAMPARDKRALLQRIENLSDAVKRARERGNSAEVSKISISERLIEYLSPV